jgi:hypothetical protein
MSRWLKPLSYDRGAVANAILEMFDKLYTVPLFSWRAFRRSAFISTVLTIVFLVEVQYDNLLDPHLYPIVALPALLANVLSDYCSLFFIRWWFALKIRSAILSLMIGAAIAALIILLFFSFRMTLLELISGTWEYGPSWEVVREVLGMVPYTLLYRTTNLLFLTSTLVGAALAVHLWLPLLVIGVLVIRTGNYLLRAVTFMRWFLDKGDEHPIKAIGYVAATVVFVAATTTTILGRFLS